MTDRCPDCERLALRNHTLEVEFLRLTEVIEAQQRQINELKKRTKDKSER